MSKNGESENGEVLLGMIRAAEAWASQGKSTSLERWLDREIDGEGAPIRLAISDWGVCLRTLLLARTERPDWPASLEERTRSLLRSVLRFSRTDGTLATQFNGEFAPATRANLQALARAFPTTSEARVLGWWLSLSRTVHVPPPLPAWSSDRHPLAVLRATWQKHDDMVVVDHRQRGGLTRLEVIGSGHSWLGPEWTSTSPAGPATAARPRHWSSNSVADLAEWSYRCGGLTITRSALLLRGRQMALLADEVEGKTPLAEPLASRFALPPDLTASPLPDCRGLLLSVAGKRAKAQVLPLALPCLPYETERGEFRACGDAALALQITPQGKKCWLPLLVSWNPERHRKQRTWRILTVSERSRTCGPDEAFAVRVSWGRDDTLVVYRSLTAPARRAFLGHLTTARFLVGKFTSEGVVEPILSVE